MDKIREWLDTTQYKDYSIEVASADASFRKYYRLKKDDKTYILMDSSLEKESLKPFIQVSEKLLHVKVSAPKIYKKDIQKGYLVIEDFDNTNLLDILDGSNFKEYYQKAIDTIVLMQNADTSSLPLYNAEFLHVEMDLMSEWYIQKLLHVKLDRAQKELIKRALDYICETVLAQPQNIFVHRDFHSRNIMIKADKTLGIIDYQDAMNGSLCYDLVSLLKDCYIEFDTKEIDSLALGFRDKKGLHVSDEEFLRWFDFTGMQRHIKVLGIFSRLYLRDSKDGYLKDIPLTLKYLINTAKRYEHTREFALLMQEITTRRA